MKGEREKHYTLVISRQEVNYWSRLLLGQLLQLYPVSWWWFRLSKHSCSLANIPSKLSWSAAKDAPIGFDQLWLAVTWRRNEISRNALHIQLQRVRLLGFWVSICSLKCSLWLNGHWSCCPWCKLVDWCALIDWRIHQACVYFHEDIGIFPSSMNDVLIFFFNFLIMFPDFSTTIHECLEEEGLFLCAPLFWSSQEWNC